MNTKWDKVANMSNEERYNLQEYRISQLEKNQEEMRNNISDIKEVVYRLDKKLTTIPEGGLQCPLHQMRMTDLEQRMNKQEDITEKLTKKIITWTAIASVILFLLSQFVVPYVIENFKVSHKTEQNAHN